MKAFFGSVTSLSLRFFPVTVVMIILVLVFGTVAVTQLNQELLPPVEFPQTIILSQVSGMTSDEVLNVLTKRIETRLAEIDEIVNIETTTTGAFGSVIIARNNFGIDSEKLQANLQAAIDEVWLPLRRIQPEAGQDGQAFASDMLGEMTSDVLIYLAESDTNFLFQLSPEVWSALPDQTVREVLAYLAAQLEASDSGKSALAQLVDQQIVPQLNTVDLVANVSISGGQALPGDENFTAAPVEAETAPESLLLQLSPKVWAVAAPKAGIEGALDENAVTALREVNVTIPETAPELPESWQRDHYFDATDLQESTTLTTTLSGVFNNFYNSGRIVSALGQTNDLTPETVTQLLEIAPSLVNYLEAEQLVALSPEVFAVLPEDYIANLDGFTRDALAAKALAQSITGAEANLAPVNLPSAWRIRPPQLITFSFADIPLATFSVSTKSGQVAAATEDQTPVTEDVETAETTQPETPTQQPVEVPEGPALPPAFSLIGTALGLELNTADDLIGLELPETMAQQFGSSTLRAADLLNFLMLLGNPEALPAGVEAPSLPFNPSVIVGTLTPEVAAFLAEYDPTFVPNLSEEVFAELSNDVLALPEIAPPLADVWDALAGQPQFADQQLSNVADLIAIGGGSASQVLNTINETVPGQFAGYEVRLFDSLTPVAVRYLTLHEEGFYTNLDPAVLLKMSPEVLQTLPEETLSALPSDVAADLTAIASGEKNSAFADLRELYTTDVPAADPNAPALNADWAFIGDFIGIELDTADDFSRFFPEPVNFLNSLFDSPQGASFAPNLFGGLTPESFGYMVQREPAIADNLRVEALQLLTPETLAILPESAQERAVSGGEPFTPTDRVTRTNGASSLQVTVFKTREANTVAAFHRVEEVMHEIQAENPDLLVDVAFEQASFIEESISGVAREGSLGALFAMVVILVFLSGGHWNSGPRRITGIVMVVVFALTLAWYVLTQAPAYTGDFGAWTSAMGEGVVFFFLLVVGILIGIIVAVSPFSLPYPAWRATLVIGVSIPLSVLAAMIGMRWFSPAVHNLLEPLAETSPLFNFLIRLFPENLTLNIMTLSGLTVAIGRVVDDSIVVLENIFRQMQQGVKMREAVISGTRDVSLAIFVATIVTVVVFLPLGLTGGLIGEFFLPFGLAVTYALMASFIVAIGVVPLLTLIFIRAEDEIEEEQTILERTYLPVLRWSLSSTTAKLIVFVIAVVSAAFGFALFGGRPAAFLPAFGDPQIGVNVDLPAGTKIVETNELVLQFEDRIREIIPAEQIGTVQAIVGGGGQSIESFLTGGGVSENVASITIAVEADEAELNAFTGELRTAAYEMFGEDNVVVSAASLSEQGFGGFALVLSGPQEDIETVNERVIATIDEVPGIANVSSNLAAAGAAGDDAPTTYLRIDGETAIRYTAELETENTIGVTQQALEAIQALPDLPETIKVSQGFESETQIQGFASLFTAMIIAVIIMVGILILTFGSPVYWLAIIFSIVVAPVGAAVALTLTDRVLGISAMIGLLMLLGIVVTNAVVLIDRAHTNDVKRRMPLKEALTEAGERRLRPIIMTALATIGALMPLAIGLSKGAIIASELGTVVIGGLFSSTLLTLIVVPVAYSVFHPIHNAIMGIFGRERQPEAQGSSAD